MLMAAAGAVRSERWNVITLIPLARQRESSSCPNVPCERRTDPAEPHPRPTRDSAPSPDQQHSHTPGTHPITSTTRFNP